MVFYLDADYYISKYLYGKENEIEIYLNHRRDYVYLDIEYCTDFESAKCCYYKDEENNTEYEILPIPGRKDSYKLPLEFKTIYFQLKKYDIDITIHSTKNVIRVSPNYETMTGNSDRSKRFITVCKDVPFPDPYKITGRFEGDYFKLYDENNRMITNISDYNFEMEATILSNQCALDDEFIEYTNLGYPLKILNEISGYFITLNLFVDKKRFIRIGIEDEGNIDGNFEVHFY